MNADIPTCFTWAISAGVGPNVDCSRKRPTATVCGSKADIVGAPSSPRRIDARRDAVGHCADSPPLRDGPVPPGRGARLIEHERIAVKGKVRRAIGPAPAAGARGGGSKEPGEVRRRV